MEYGAFTLGDSGSQTSAATPRCLAYEPLVDRRSSRLSWVRIAASTLSAAVIAAALLGCLLFVLPSVSRPREAAELAIGAVLTDSQEQIRPPGPVARALINGCANVFAVRRPGRCPCNCLSDFSDLWQESCVTFFRQQHESTVRPRLVSLAA